MLSATFSLAQVCAGSTCHRESDGDEDGHGHGDGDGDGGYIGLNNVVANSLYRFWTQILQNLLSGADERQYIELRSRGGVDSQNAGEISMVTGLLPGRFEHVPAPVVNFDCNDGDVCSFTLNSEAQALFGRDHLK